MPLNDPRGRTDVRSIIAATCAAHERIVYFAHSLRDYDTARAAAALEVVRRYFPAAHGWGVLNPADWGRTNILGEFATYDAFYRAAVEPVAAVACLEHEGHIGRGVYSECRIALDRPVPCYAVRGAVLRRVVNVRIVDPNDWRCFYGRTVLAGATAE